jgi:hypothetical protein
MAVLLNYTELIQRVSGKDVHEFVKEFHLSL